MANMTASRLGLKIGGADNTELFLKVFAGEVLAAFEEKNIMMDKHVVRTITSGKSAQFPRTWKSTASYHTPGVEITGNSIDHTELVVTIDSLLIADAFIASIDEAMNHYEVRSLYSKELGNALANEFDTVVLRNLVLGAEASEAFTSKSSAGTVHDIGTSATGATLATGLFDARRILDDNDVPETDTYAVFNPTNYYKLVSTTDNINQDWNASGSYAEGKIVKVAGIPIFKTTHLPTTLAYTLSGGGTLTKYDLATVGLAETKLVGMVWHKSGAATVKLMDLAVESEYLIKHQGTLMVAKYACGHSYLRPESCVALRIT